MKKIYFPFLISILFLYSCHSKVELLEGADTNQKPMLLFISSEIMGPNSKLNLNDFQKMHASFYIDNPEAIKALKQKWVFNALEIPEQFEANYQVIYTEDGQFRSQTGVDIQANIAIGGFGPSEFDLSALESFKNHFKPLNYKFLSFDSLQHARRFFQNIKAFNWILPTANLQEYLQWGSFNGECIVQINNAQFARDKDVEKALKDYMPKRFINDTVYYKLFRFTPENSTVRICSNADLSSKFPPEFKVAIPWKSYQNIIIPLIHFDEVKLNQILKSDTTLNFKVLDKIE